MRRRARERRQALIETLEGLRDVGPLNGGRFVHCRTRFLRLAAALREDLDYQKPPNLAGLLRGTRCPLVSLWRVPVTVLIVAGLLFGGTGVGVAAQDRAPGDLLYPVKTTLEQGRAYVTVEPTSRVRLASAYVDRRIEELGMLLDAQRYGGVPVATDGLTRWVYAVGESLGEAAAQDGLAVRTLAEGVAEDATGWAEALNDAVGRVPASLRAKVVSVAALVDVVAAAAASIAEGNGAPTMTIELEGGDASDGPGPSTTLTADEASTEADEHIVPPGQTRTPPGLDDSVTPPGLEREDATKSPPGQVKPKKTKEK
ncbi:MAG: hypothetical protein J7M15_03550 [Anaerolineae bacterium]|nr:hypothetical protein [Anaerolineae bacterium]